MGEYKKVYKGHSGHSYGIQYLVRFTYLYEEDGWAVYNFRTGKVYAKNLESWEAPDRCMEENVKLGFDMSPDVSAIDSTP